MEPRGGAISDASPGAVADPWLSIGLLDLSFATQAIASQVVLRDGFGSTHAMIDATRDDLGPHEILPAGGRTVVRLHDLTIREPS